jgi:hypothetical protein
MAGRQRRARARVGSGRLIGGSRLLRDEGNNRNFWSWYNDRPQLARMTGRGSGRTGGYTAGGRPARGSATRGKGGCHAGTMHRPTGAGPPLPACTVAQRHGAVKGV